MGKRIEQRVEEAVGRSIATLAAGIVVNAYRDETTGMTLVDVVLESGEKDALAAVPVVTMPGFIEMTPLAGMTAIVGFLGGVLSRPVVLGFIEDASIHARAKTRTAPARPPYKLTR